MKKQIPLSLISLLVTASSLCAATTQHEDFEGHPAGASAQSAGWQYFAGAGVLEDLTVDKPLAEANTSAGALRGAANGRDIQITKPFATSFDYTGAEQSIEYECKVFVQPTGAIVPRLLLGVFTDRGVGLPLFGIAGNESSVKDFKFTLGTDSSSQFYPAGRLYELRLQIDTAAGLGRSKATLYVRDLTAGATDWSAVSGLENVALNLGGAWSPQNWRAWYIRSSFRREIDDLKLSAR